MDQGNNAMSFGNNAYQSTYVYGGNQQAYNPYDAYNQGDATTFQWPANAQTSGEIQANPMQQSMQQQQQATWNAVANQANAYNQTAQYPTSQQPQQQSAAPQAPGQQQPLPAAIPDPSGYGTWEPAMDPRTNRIYWVNHALQKTSWDPPAASTPAYYQQNQYAYGYQYPGAYPATQQGYYQAGAYNQWAYGQQAAAAAQQPAQQPAAPAMTINANAAKAFSWSAPKPKPKPVNAQEQYTWSDGRDHGDKPESYDKNFPSLKDAAASIASKLQTKPSVQQHEVKSPAKTAAPAEPAQIQQAPAANQWPPKLQSFVQKCFSACDNEYERTCMASALKSIVQNAEKNNRLWVTDWDSQPVPRVANASGKAKGNQEKKSESHVPKSKNKKKRGGVMADIENEAEKEAREKRHRRFIDMERGYVAAGGGSHGNDDDIKFMSSEAIVGTCMEMEKQYIRLQSMPDPSTVRPERVLVKWAERLKVKYDTDEADWEWISDQFKAIRQDMVIQHIRNANSVLIYESNGRLAMQEHDFGEFYKIQSYLMGLYADTRARENEAEFMAYRLFYWMMQNNTVDMVKDIRNMPMDLKSHPYVSHALNLHRALELSDYVSFFRLFATTPNQGKCIVCILRDRMRSRALRVILRSYKPSIPFDFLRDQLAFKVKAEEGDEEGDETEEWYSFLKENCLVGVEGDDSQVDVKATSEALSAAERNA